MDSNKLNKLFTLTAIFLAGSAVVLGALGAHALKKVLTSDLLLSFETAVRYQFYHAVAILLAAVLSKVYAIRLTVVHWLFTTGILLFSGSIYLLTYLKHEGAVGLRGLGLLTPVGGIFFILGWLWLMAVVWKKLQ